MKTLIIIFTLFFHSLVLAQVEDLNVMNGFIPAVNDARARAMGRTELLSSKGANALFYNSANTIFTESPSLHTSFRGNFGDINDEQYEGDTESNWERSENHPLHFKINQISFVLPYQEPDSDHRAALSIGYNSFLDWGIKNKEKSTYLIEFENTVTEETISGGINAVSIGVAIGRNNLFGLGASFSKTMFSNIISNNKYTRNYEPTSPYVIRHTYEYELSSQFFALSGMAIMPSDITLGLVFKPSYTVELEKVTIEREYNDGDESSSTYDDIETMKIPAMFGLSVSKRINTKNMIVFEYQNRPYEKYKDKDDDHLFGEIDNSHCFRLGIEYSMKYPVRLGFFRDALPITDDDPEEKEPSALTGITIGSGINTKYFLADIFGEYAFWSYEYNNDPIYTWEESLISLGMTITIDESDIF